MRLNCYGGSLPKVSEIFFILHAIFECYFWQQIIFFGIQIHDWKKPNIYRFFVTYRIGKKGVENRYTLSIHIELIISSARDRAIVLLIAPCLIMYWWIWIRICCIYFLHESGSLIQQEDGILHTPSSGFSALTNAGHMYSLLLRLWSWLLLY